MSDKDVKSARRVFEALEYFDRERGTLGLKEIAGHLGYPSSSASVLLRSIVGVAGPVWRPEKRETAILREGIVRFMGSGAQGAML
jgi:DNA-binding IclR family transcriptional regulator